MAGVTLAPTTTHGDAAGGSGQIYNISTTGATALGNFTRGDATGAPGTSIINLGMPTLTIGGTTYTLDDDGEALGFKVKAGAGARDTWGYYYHETGSVEGVLELADGYNLTGVINRRPFDPTSGNPLYLNGNRFNETPILNDLGAAATGPTLQLNSGGANINSRNGWVVGRNFLNANGAAGTYPGSSASSNALHQIGAGTGFTTIGRNTGTDGAAYYGQDLAKIAWSDVPTFQTFANPGTSSPNARPLDDPATGGVELTAGYGKGRAQGNSNFQKLRDIDSIAGGQANFRNETVAIAPFAVVASPGTGLAKVTDVETKWLHATGRLPNGANFNSVTRDPGSGTRNQGANNVGLDPSWSSGERDRIIPDNTPSYQVVDPDGNTIRLMPGDEARPLQTLSGGSSSLLTTEDRPGPNARFSDKTSGGSRLAPAVYRHRMGIGAHLSSGDVISRTDAYSNASGRNRQTRVLAIDWTEEAGEIISGYVQPRAEDITEGRYQMWSLAQAVTVREGTDPLSPAYNNIRPHTPGVHNTQYTAAQEAALVAQHRNFLDNISGSAASLPAITNSTPGTGILQAGFIVPQIMGTQKAYDGAVQTARTRSNVDPDGAGPALSEQALWDAWRSDSTLGGVLNWADYNNFDAQVPGYNPNANSSTQVFYDIYRAANTSTTPTGGTGDANADASIVITQRLALAGDFNNDQVRDLADVPAMAKAYASPDAFLADTSLGGPAVEAAAKFDNGFVSSRVAASLNGGAAATGAAVPGKFGLMALGDLDGDGNISAADNDVAAVERDDVRYFLHGAAIDTSGFATAKAKREDGVRLGQLKKNQAIDTFNTTLDGFVGTTNNPATGTAYTQAQIDDLKFEKRDADGSGSKGIGSAGDRRFLDDALIVDGFQGKRYTNFDDAVNATVPRAFTLTQADADQYNGGNRTRHVEVGYNLVDAELNDSPDGLIDQSDLDVMNEALTTTAGVNPGGRVDHDWRSVTKSGTGTIAMNAATGTITLPAAGATFTIAAGTFGAGGTLDPFTDSAVADRHVRVINHGTLNITAGQKRVRSVTGTGATRVAADASLESDAFEGGSLAIDAGAVVSLRESTPGGTRAVNRLGSLTIAGAAADWQGKLDLGDGDLVLETDEASRGALLARVSDQVRSARSAAERWTGNGIASSAAHDNPLTGLSVGLLDDHLVVKYTYNGDANLDGRVNADDYFRIDQGFLAQLQDPGYAQGDFNYDGRVNADDYFLIDQAFLGQGSSFGATTIIAPGGLSIVAVPEPSAAALAIAAGASLFVRRPRRRPPHR